MSYKIFLSYAGEEKQLAESVRNSLNNAFKGKVEILFDNIRGGDKWKDVILKGLNDSDAILTILTPRYVQKPWAYIEWSAFWLRDKTTFVMVTDDVEMKDIVDPMKDIQCTRLFDESDIVKLLGSIANKAGEAFVPYEITNNMVHTCKAAYDNILVADERSRYSIYKAGEGLLPNDDFKKVEIFWYYYDKEHDNEAASNIFKTLNDNAIKANVLMKLLEKNDLDLIEKLYEYVQTKNNLLPLLKGLVENGEQGSLLAERMLEYIAESQSAIRSFCEYLIKNNKVDSNLFITAIPLFDNRAELRKVGEYIITNGFVREAVFDNIVQRFYGHNHAELQKLLRYAINAQHFDKLEMLEQIERLAGFNKTEANKVLIELINRDRTLEAEFPADIRDLHNEISLQHLSKLIKQLRNGNADTAT